MNSGASYLKVASEHSHFPTNEVVFITGTNNQGKVFISAIIIRTKREKSFHSLQGHQKSSLMTDILDTV